MSASELSQLEHSIMSRQWNKKHFFEFVLHPYSFADGPRLIRNGKKIYSESN
jgi:hypothetical protein